MKRLRISVHVLLFALAALGSASAATCSKASLAGVVGFFSTGYDGPDMPGTSVGQMNFNGKGKVSGSWTHNNGTATTLTFTGTYTVASNCTGSIVLNTSAGTTENDNFILDNANSGMQLIRTDASEVKSGYAVAEGTVTCGLTGKKQSFAANVSGTTLSLTALAYVGQVILDGKGNVSGSGTFNNNGTLATGALTGTYTESSNCTGTMQVTPAGGETSNLSFVVVNGGKELLVIQTDSGSIVSGNAQQ